MGTRAVWYKCQFLLKPSKHHPLPQHSSSPAMQKNADGGPYSTTHSVNENKRSRENWLHFRRAQAQSTSPLMDAYQPVLANRSYWKSAWHTKITPILLSKGGGPPTGGGPRVFQQRESEPNANRGERFIACGPRAGAVSAWMTETRGGEIAHDQHPAPNFCFENGGEAPRSGGARSRERPHQSACSVDAGLNPPGTATCRRVQQRAASPAPCLARNGARCRLAGPESGSKLRSAGKRE